jgi:hypothetical protein
VIPAELLAARRSASLIPPTNNREQSLVMGVNEENQLRVRAKPSAFAKRTNPFRVDGVGSGAVQMARFVCKSARVAWAHSANGLR